MSVSAAGQAGSGTYFQIGEVWTQLAISKPNKITLSFTPQVYNVGSITIPFSNSPRRSHILLSIGYFMPAKPSVTCAENLSYRRLSNGTALVRTQFIIKSGENTTIDVKLLRLNDMLRSLTDNPLATDRSHVALYWNNIAGYFSAPTTYFDGMAPYYGAIPPFGSINFTITMSGPGAY